MAVKKIKLLIVDDEERFLDSMKARLELRGFEVVTVNRGDKALETAGAEDFDIVLLDLKMPGMNGEQTLKELRQLRGDMEIIILTGHGSVESVIECTSGGAYSYLQKPCEMEKLLEAVRDAYKKRVMSRMNIDEKMLNEILQSTDPATPIHVLEKLREIAGRG